MGEPGETLHILSVSLRKVTAFHAPKSKKVSPPPGGIGRQGNRGKTIPNLVNMYTVFDRGPTTPKWPLA
jgi:hypothetical protein